jgi:hypothetical protein
VEDGTAGPLHVVIADELFENASGVPNLHERSRTRASRSTGTSSPPRARPAPLGAGAECHEDVRTWKVDLGAGALVRLTLHGPRGP